MGELTEWTRDLFSLTTNIIILIEGSVGRKYPISGDFMIKIYMDYENLLKRSNINFLGYTLVNHNEILIKIEGSYSLSKLISLIEINNEKTYLAGISDNIKIYIGINDDINCSLIYNPYEHKFYRHNETTGN